MALRLQSCVKLLGLAKNWAVHMCAPSLEDVFQCLYRHSPQSSVRLVRGAAPQLMSYEGGGQLRLRSGLAGFDKGCCEVAEVRQAQRRCCGDARFAVSDHAGDSDFEGSEDGGSSGGAGDGHL